MWSRITFEQLPEESCVFRRVASRDGAARNAQKPRIFGCDLQLTNLSILDPRGARGGGRAHLVEPIFSMHDEPARGAQRRERVRKHRHKVACIDAQQLEARARGIRERPEHIEDGAHSELTARPGDRVNLSALGSTDPDGDALSYEWFYYGEPGSFTVSSAASGQPLAITGFDQTSASFVVPTGRVMPPGTGTMHIILALTDHGAPRLTRYQRVIVTVVR
jgi:hypothetical protein